MTFRSEPIAADTHYLACQGCAMVFPLDSIPLGEPCDLCGGQLVEVPAAASRYGAGERHEAAPLFTPAPEPMPGQTEMPGDFDG
jgi:hypothetical protein